MMHCSRVLPACIFVTLLSGVVWSTEHCGALAALEAKTSRPHTSVQLPASLLRGAANTRAYEIEVSAQGIWTATGFKLQRGDRILLTAKSIVAFPIGQIAGPQGINDADLQGLTDQLPIRNAARGALVARIGEKDMGSPLLVGAKKEIEVLHSGNLYLGTNESDPGEGYGAFKVHLKLERRALASQSNQAARALIPSALLAKIPPALAIRKATRQTW